MTNRLDVGGDLDLSDKLVIELIALRVKLIQCFCDNRTGTENLTSM